jgi:tRNA A37 methylthiotransferase MiaB
MEQAGFQKADFQSGADLYVINTCSVTDHADRKCKKVVREALKYNPDAYVVVVGCYAQLKPEEISNIPGVDMVLGAAEKFNLASHLDTLVKEPKSKVFNAPIKETTTFVPGFSEGERTRTFMKVQDGCDYFCTFCTIPLARGASRSATIEETIEKVKPKIDFDTNGNTKNIISQLSERLLFRVDDAIQKDMEDILKYDFDTKSENANQAVLRLFNYISKTPEYQLI